MTVLKERTPLKGRLSHFLKLVTITENTAEYLSKYCIINEKYKIWKWVLLLGESPVLKRRVRLWDCQRVRITSRL